MARRRQRQRDANVHHYPVLSIHLPNPLSHRVSHAPKKPDLRPFEDRRQFHPLKHQAPPAVKKQRSARRIVNPYQDHFRFARPRQLPLCERRQRRKEVLFAKRLTGKGSRARIRRRTEFSNVSCRG